MFDVDDDVDALDLPLALHGFILPQAALDRSAQGRRIDRSTGLDVIGLTSEDESFAFDFLDTTL